MYVSIYVHVCIYAIGIYTFRYAYRQTCMSLYVYAYECMNLCICIYVGSHMYVHTYIFNICIHTYCGIMY